MPVRARARERKHDEPYKEPPGSSSEATAATRNSARGVTGDNYTDPDSLAGDDDVRR